MQWIINLIRGSVTVEVWGAFPERLLNLCAQNGVGFWDLQWIDETTFRFTVSFRAYQKLDGLARRAMCEIRGPRGAGLPALAVNLRERYFFWGGLAFCVLAISVFSHFVLVVDVTGNETVPTAVILSELAYQGLRVGSFGPALEERELANAALIELEELSFLSVKLSGCRAEVEVREAEPKPELLNQSSPADIVSVAPGIITELTVTSGQALVQKGDTVLAGETIISGYMDLPEVTLSETDSGYYIVRAAGEAWARTWRTLQAQVPLNVQVKEHTGRIQTRFALILLGERVNFYQNSGISYARYDKITQVSPLEVPGGVRLPVSLVQETAREYTLLQAQLNQNEAIGLLEDSLRRELDDILQQTGGECLRTDYTAAVEDGMLTVTLLAECYEQIGKTVEREGEVGFIPGAGG